MNKFTGTSESYNKTEDIRKLPKNLTNPHHNINSK